MSVYDWIESRVPGGHASPQPGERAVLAAGLPGEPLYGMTPEFGAASQLEKIDMLDFAELVVLNKFDKRGAEDALPAHTPAA